MPKRPWMQIRLATLFGLLALCAVGLAWWGKRRRAMEEERAALAAIRDGARGCVFFAEQWDPVAQWPRSLATEPERTWSDYLLARNALRRVTAVSLDCNCREDFANTNPFGTWFILNGPLPQESLNALARFPRLAWLEFDPTLTDEELARVPPLPALETLSLEACRHVTARGLNSLDRFPRLRSLNLSGSKFSWTSGVRWSAAERLRSLDMTYAQFTNDDLAALSTLDALEHLELDHTPVTNQGLLHLYGLKRLRRLNLQHTQVTRIGVYRLRKQLPKLQVTPPFDDDE